MELRVGTRGKLIVIGAGPVGLGMAAALKAHGIDYDQVDASSGIGGNWRHGVYDMAHIVSSKRATAYADFPMPDDYPDFPSAAQMLAYLEDYARSRSLVGGIELGRKVVAARPLPDEGWHIRFEDGEERVYKGVVVCNGHHWAKRWPSYPGAFSGPMLHSKDYRQPGQLAGKRVLIIGAGNSACDLACDSARVAVSCDMSLRGGYWFLPKTAFGRPLTDLPIWSLPVPVQRLILRALVKVMIGDYRSYGLPKPTHRIFERHPTFGTDVLGYVKQGRIKPRPEVARYDGRTVHFIDGSCGEYDVIVAATGYHNSLPFLPAGLIEVRNDAAQIYGGAFPARVKNLYIVGSTQPRGGFGSLLTPAADLFARMIRLQDEIEHPIGDVLAWLGEPLPETNLIDPAWAKRQIRLGHRLLWYLKWQGRRLDRLQPRAALPRELMAEREPLARPLVVN